MARDDKVLWGGRDGARRSLVTWLGDATAEAAQIGTKPTSPATDGAGAARLKVWLLGVSPMLWRRLRVPSGSTLRELHGIVQVAMGWEGIHLYQFCLRARRLAARFVRTDLYDAPAAIPGPASFDLVYATWGTIAWLPDVARWARVVAHFLRPGGALYFADAHPAALVFDDVAGADAEGEPGRPGWFAPYFGRGPVVVDDPSDYADPAANLANARQVVWLHPLGDV